MSLIEQIEQKFIGGEWNGKTSREIARLLGVTGKREREEVAAALHELLRQGKLARDKNHRYEHIGKAGLYKGVLQGNERGFAFCRREEGCDLFIPHRSLHGAMHGDTVLVRLVGGARGDEGEVHGVLSRGYAELVGVFYKEKKCGWVYPDERKYSKDVRVLSSRVHVRSGEKVVVKITEYPEGGSPAGEIIEVLGAGGELAVEEDSIIRSANLEEEFPQKVLSEAKRASEEEISPKGRKDFRGHTIITIDGDDSRDFDDAVEVQKKGKHYILGVHIADVTHYVKRGHALDTEAYRRGTSVYFPDRVIPMLPPELSNGICSLNEGEDRYVLSCEMKIDGKGNVKSYKLYEGIINSAARMTYKKVAKILDGDKALREEYRYLTDMLEDMRELAEILSAKRSARGSIDLDVKEASITLAGGKVEVGRYERTAAHKIIEEFMILANETVAEFIAAKGLPFIYRVHEKPGEEKASAFLSYLRETGVNARFDPREVRPGEYGKILEGLAGSPLFDVVNRVMLRSMSKARYSPQNEGHFGLASPCYCHFTSPIRRYPDLLAHRIVKAALEGNAGEAESFSRFTAAASISCSESERKADEAERAVDELFKVWYMRERLGQTFDAVVSGVTSFGVFAELPNTVEGLIRIENLPADDYAFIENRYLLRGRGHSYQIGTPVRVKVVSADVGARKCEFLIV